MGMGGEKKRWPDIESQLINILLHDHNHKEKSYIEEWVYDLL